MQEPVSFWNVTPSQGQPAVWRALGRREASAVQCHFSRSAHPLPLLRRTLRSPRECPGADDHLTSAVSKRFFRFLLKMKYFSFIRR